MNAERQKVLKDVIDRPATYAEEALIQAMELSAEAMQAEIAAYQIASQAMVCALNLAKQTIDELNKAIEASQKEGIGHTGLHRVIGMDGQPSWVKLK